MIYLLIAIWIIGNITTTVWTILLFRRYNGEIEHNVDDNIAVLKYQ